MPSALRRPVAIVTYQCALVCTYTVNVMAFQCSARATFVSSAQRVTSLRNETVNCSPRLAHTQHGLELVAYEFAALLRNPSCMKNISQLTTCLRRQTTSGPCTKRMRAWTWMDWTGAADETLTTCESVHSRATRCTDAREMLSTNLCAVSRHHDAASGGACKM